ncbi:hypothetical protein PHLCEN_2v2966 [Hermanssonia centrifuga]|uniref:Uncharacterized protein n=1 Tax=Hermanssonia centrifuga TaxID=98765 RepID=A0A2R6REN1_9APHY|nr:hypothetical protein PHLCEN_2v2966 [Hermanssonia centrifuga]
MASHPKIWKELVRRSPSTGESIRWRDGLVGCATDDGKSVITSPNMSYIPRPTYGTTWISIKADGHYGQADPTQWPQVLVEKSRFPWFAAVPRYPSLPHQSRFLVMWSLLPLTEFVPLAHHMKEVLGDVKLLGTVHQRRREKLEPLVEEIVRKAAEFQTRHGRNRELDCIVTTMKDTFERLNYPSTYRDLVRQHACVQRYWRMAKAWFEWHIDVMKNYTLDDKPSPRDSHVRQHLMGAYTTSPVIAKRLFDLGVPVWFARTVDHLTSQDVIQTVVHFEEPKNIIVEEGIFTDAKGFLGLAGSEAHLNFIMTNGNHYADLEETMMPAPASFRPVSSFDPVIKSRNISTASSSYTTSPATAQPAHGKHQVPAKRPCPEPQRDSDKPRSKKPNPSEREKFQPFKHALMPPSIPVWERALASVDLSTPSPSGDAVWKFWFPEPKLVISSEVAERQMRYLMNWLRVRTAWLYIVTHRSMQDGIIGPLKALEWREYLNSSNQSEQDILRVQTQESKHTRRKKDVSTIFQLVLGVKSVLEIPVPREWFGHSLQGAPAEEAALCHRQMIWELCEVAFRYELLQLDRYLVPIDEPDYERHLSEHERRRLIASVFPNDFVMTALPTRIDGLAALDVSTRLPYLECLQKILSRWPGAPDDICSTRIRMYASSVPRVEWIEKQMAEFYCQTFYQVAGRAPILPRRFPVS